MNQPELKCHVYTLIFICSTVSPTASPTERDTVFNFTKSVLRGVVLCRGFRIFRHDGITPEDSRFVTHTFGDSSVNLSEQIVAHRQPCPCKRKLSRRLRYRGGLGITRCGEKTPSLQFRMLSSSQQIMSVCIFTRRCTCADEVLSTQV